MVETKPDPAGEQAGSAPPKHLSLRVKDQSENELTFKLKTTSPLEKLMKAYASAQGKAPDSLRFLHDGRRIQLSDTPETLEMEDGDLILAMTEQEGGAELS